MEYMESKIQAMYDAYDNEERRMNEIYKALEKVVNAWNNGGGFALVEACTEAKSLLEN